MKKIVKVMELSDKVLQLIDEQVEDKLTRSDLQACVEAIIMQAIDYGESEV